MTDWDDQALSARIKRPGKERFAAGSPDVEEVSRYRRLLERALRGAPRTNAHKVLVLGMTPELRRVAADLSCQVFCIDANPAAIEMYRDWLTPAQRACERIIQGDWLDLPRLLQERVDVIMGDGVFGNLLAVSAHRALLNHFISCLLPAGAVILRKIIIPHDFRVEDHSADVLIQAFRKRQISPEEFGFGMRIWGSFKDAYDAGTMLLDNRVVFERYGRWLETGRISAAEHALIQRYYFMGKNLIPPETLWERLLSESGFEFQRQETIGQAWYKYYPIYFASTSKLPLDVPGNQRDT